MRKYFLLLFLMSTVSFTIFAQSEPNIIFILGDDISWDDIGVYGNRSVKTPNIDKLAKDGIRFDHMYLTASSCSPSRTSILTGRYPHNTGAAELHSPLPGHLAYFPELLKNKGYFSALVGKWHEGPLTKRAYDTILVDKTSNGEGGEKQWINLLKSRPKNKPFFFWLAAYDAHRPWDSSPDGPATMPVSNVSVPPTLVDTKETRQDLAAYYHEIERLDYYIGQLQEQLQKEGLADNTIIIFTADNGRPFPGSKTRLTDAGLRTPFILRWPKEIRPGQTCQSLISSIDIAPTLLEAAGVKPAETIQGLSFFSLLKEPGKEFRKYVFAEHKWHDYAAYERSVRSKDFLYILNKRPQFDNGGPIDANQSASAKALKTARTKGKLTVLQNDAFVTPRPVEEFFDCIKNPLQTENLIENQVYAKQIMTLKTVLQNWREQTGDTEPLNITPDWYDRQTGEKLPANGTRGEMPGKSKNADRINLKGP